MKGNPINSCENNSESNAARSIRIAGISIYCTVGGILLALFLLAALLIGILGLGFILYVGIQVVCAF